MLPHLYYPPLSVSPNTSAEVQGLSHDKLEELRLYVELKKEKV